MAKKLFILDAKEALKRFKAETANEVGITLKQLTHKDLIIENNRKVSAKK